MTADATDRASTIDPFMTVAVISAVVIVFVAWLLTRWEISEINKLPPDARKAFDTLCDEGCDSTALLASRALFGRGPAIECELSDIIGDRSKRLKARKALENAALVLEDLHPAPSSYRTVAGQISTSELIGQMWSQAKTLRELDDAFDMDRIATLRNFGRFFLTRHVGSKMRKPCDRVVATFIGEFISVDEEDQRKWRRRYIKRLEDRLSAIRQFLFSDLDAGSEPDT